MSLLSLAPCSERIGTEMCKLSKLFPPFRSEAFITAAESRVGKLEYAVSLLAFHEVTFSFLKICSVCVLERVCAGGGRGSPGAAVMGSCEPAAEGAGSRSFVCFDSFSTGDRKKETPEILKIPL